MHVVVRAGQWKMWLMFEIFIKFITIKVTITITIHNDYYIDYCLSLPHHWLYCWFPLVEEEQDKHEIHDQPGDPQPGVQPLVPRALERLHSATCHSLGLKQQAGSAPYFTINILFFTILDLPIWLRSSSESVSVSEYLVSRRLAVDVATGNVGLQTVSLNVCIPSWCRTISISRLASEFTDVLMSESTVVMSPDILKKIDQIKMNYSSSELNPCKT